MAHLSGIQIGKQTRALAAALALGAVVLSLSPGQTAFAARARSAGAGDSDTGAGQTATHRTPGSGTATRTIDPAKRCTITGPDGHIEFYLPGTEITRNGNVVVCMSDGEWYAARPGPTDETTVGGGGVRVMTP